MDIRFYSTFLEVSETRHFGKAAEKLFITQAAVSARIRSLEEFYATPLFTRDRNHIQLTLAGEKLLPFAKQLVATLQQSKQYLKTHTKARLRIATTEMSDTLLAKGIYEFAVSHHNQCSIKSDVLGSELISRYLHDSIIDIGFTTVPVKSDEIVSHCVFTSPLALYSAESGDSQPAINVRVRYPLKCDESLQQQFTFADEPAVETGNLQHAAQLATTLQTGVILPVLWAQHAKHVALHHQADATGEPIAVYACHLKQCSNEWVARCITAMSSKMSAWIS
ncbi:LysR family transcriptional regulator [Alteromonas sp. ASW11-36]|uniref:LysR family transcriptional regulator n=1 Tax=Alteromonas arenosi TaxID=3055817 RepID=A0ABT7SWX8_9ALTE|nr:LysR family transcriptional regulator [Alteromonas sp. ASW11-36]MDM7860697.1 LysR family transcriptional regulator [Alteromonas sp. ASW11-36]